MNRRTLTRAIAALFALPFAGLAQAQAFPSKPMRLVVPFAAGGSSDVMARTLARTFTDSTGQQVVVENRPGAGGHIAGEYVAKSAPDGYTMLFGTIGTHGIGPAIYKKLPYDPLKDLAAVSALHTHPNVLIVHPSLNVKNVQELVAMAKAKPGTLSFASAGNGSVSHLAGDMLKTATGISLIHVPYKGGGAAITDLVSGQVSMMLETIPNALALSRGGKVRPLAVTSSQRWHQSPELPTMAESGVPGYVVDSWTGLFTTGGTPRPVVDRLYQEVVKANKTPSYVEQFKTMGVDCIASTPDQFQSFLRDEVAKWGKAIADSGAKVD